MMTLMTVQDRRWFSAYGQLGGDELEMVDVMFDGAIDAMQMMGRQPFQGDSAAALRGAITRYVIECR